MEDTIVCPLDSFKLDAGNPGSTYLWTTGDTTREIWASTTGVGFSIQTFGVTVTNQNDCIDSDELTVIFDWSACVGMDDHLINAGIGIYPNPTTGIVSIEINDYEIFSGDLEILIFNASGSLIDSQTIVTNTSNSEKKYISFNLNDQQNGMYYIYFRSKTFSHLSKIILR